ncbi:MAG: SPOR domain-containing protein [Deltaproteobacteria bacterium]|nr:SPOR domain-containing protein [Deltaproteobacteria bacterium]
MIIKQWGFAPPAGQRSPRPNVRRFHLKQFLVPVAIGVTVMIGLGILFGKLFPSKPSDNADVKNTITQAVPISNQTDKEPTQAGGTTSNASKESIPRKPLVADSPIVKAALKAAPVSSPVEALGQIAGRKAPPSSLQTRTETSSESRSPGKSETKDTGRDLYSASVTDSKIKTETKPKPKPPEVKTESKPEPKPEPKPEAKPKPEAPKEQATAKQTAKPAAAETNGGGVQFTVHLGSFTDKSNADHAMTKLKNAGIPAYITRIELDGKTWHRLMAGKFANRAQAEAYGKDLKQRGLTADTGAYTIKPIVGQ